MAFTKKKLTSPQSIPSRLQQAREQLRLSLDQVAAELKMNHHHLELIESGAFHQLPFASIYQKKLLGNYAALLGLPKTTIMKQFEIETRKKEKNQSVTLNQTHTWHWHMPWLVRISSVSLIALLVFSYLGLQVKQIIDPPELQLFTPLDGLITKTQSVEVKGKTEKEVKITINGNEVRHDEQGVFAEPINLSQGVNTIVIAATTKHGKTTTLTRYVVAQKERQFSLGQTSQNHN